jgi:hypothetical protein
LQNHRQAEGLKMSEKITFLHLCRLFQRLERINLSATLKRAEKFERRGEILSKWFASLPPVDNLYSVTRLLLPHLDREIVYYMKEMRIVEYLTSSDFGLSLGRKFGEIIRSWRTPSQEDGSELKYKGDLSAIVGYVYDELAIGGVESVSIAETVSFLTRLAQLANRDTKGFSKMAQSQQCIHFKQFFMVNFIIFETYNGKSHPYNNV